MLGDQSAAGDHDGRSHGSSIVHEPLTCTRAHHHVDLQGTQGLLRPSDRLIPGLTDATGNDIAARSAGLGWLLLHVRTC